MLRRLLCLTIFVIFVAGCSSTQILRGETQPSVTKDLPPITLAPTRTSLPTGTLTPLPLSELEITPTATLISSAGTPAAPTLHPALYLPFTRIKMISSLDGWAWDTDIVWRTSDGGMSWTDVTPSNFSEFGFALDKETAWATIFHREEDNTLEGLVRTTDGGKTWIFIAETHWRDVSDYEFYDLKNGLISGCGAAAGSGICMLYETKDGGLTWNPVEFVTDHRGDLGDWPGRYDFCNICGDAIYFDQNLLVVVGGNLAQNPQEQIPVWLTSDRGQSWRNCQLPLPNSIYSPGWFNPHTPVFFGDLEGIAPVKLANLARDQFAMAFYRTQDGGASWKLLSLVEDLDHIESWSIMNFVSSRDLYFACGSELCASHDGGVSWKRISSNLVFSFAEGQPKVWQFYFVDALNGWALVGDSWYEVLLWRTTDGGKTWHQLFPDFYPK